MILCVNPRCRIPGRHADDCADDACRGCLRAQAADGLRLCEHCTRRIGRDAVEIAWLWYEIGLALVASGSTGTPVQNPHPGMAINAAAVVMRAEIRQVLASWTKLVCEERGLTLPLDESQHSLGAFIAAHSQWLAAQDFADEVTGELSSLRSRAWATAYPEGVSVRLIGPCPERDTAPNAPDPQSQCPGSVKALMRRSDSLLPSKVVCDVNSTHEWPAERWRTLGRSMGMVLAQYASAEEIHAASGRSMSAIYRLASLHAWRRVADGRRVRYLTVDVRHTLGWAA
ncbi:hypothetical protein [Lysinibacillus fusiformis]|uniref:hypothetical protein n=1 Tax=Lysinibacillus fusiformis TaxID=28031 RepID=UPI003D03E2BA